jgi:hypothetical protein
LRDGTLVRQLQRIKVALDAFEARLTEVEDDVEATNVVVADHEDRIVALEP